MAVVQQVYSILEKYVVFRTNWHEMDPTDIVVS